MSRAWHSLRVRLAVLGFLAIYVPVLLLFGVVLATDVEQEVDARNDGPAVRSTTTHRSPWVAWTIVALAPAAGGLAWWWAGRAVQPINRVRAVAEEIEATDLDRRIGLARGPVEVVSLAASFDAMLDRLERAADGQRRLIEETSHELRVPLAVLLNNAEVLLTHPEPTVAVYRQGLQRSKAAAKRLQAVIDELLVDARGRARMLDRQPADVVAIARGVADEAGVPAAARGIRLSLRGPASAEAAVDEPTVRRALANLVDNAIRYAPRDSAVKITVEATDADVTVVVTDHGPGIAPEARDSVFERFWRGRHDVHGTGLGLPIARQIAAAHGGDLTVRSPGPAGDGCEFRLTLRR